MAWQHSGIGFGGTSMFRRFWRSKRGNFAVITAIASLPLLAGVAGVVDYTFARNKASQLQNALDASALAIATNYFLGMTDEELTDFGQQYFDTNMVGVNDGAESFEFDDAVTSDLSAMASAEGNDNFITVRSAIAHEGILGALDWPIHRRSVVMIKQGAEACVLALDPHAASAVKFQGSTQVHLAGCVIASNSDSGTSIYRGGTATVSADCVNTVGTTSGIDGNSNVTLECGDILENQYSSFDPLARVTPPIPGGCMDVPNGKNKTLTSGTYCDEELSGDIELETGGVFILKGGGLKLNGNGSIKGEGVTIFLMDDAEFAVNGNEVVQLTPPTSGIYAGITLFQPKSNATTITINGTADSYVSGFVYAPGAHVFYAGNSTNTTNSECLRIVGNTIEMTGNSSMTSDCTDELGGREMYAGRYMTLVR